MRFAPFALSPLLENGNGQNPKRLTLFLLNVPEMGSRTRMKSITDEHGYEPFGRTCRAWRLPRFLRLTAPVNAYKSADKRIGTFLMGREEGMRYVNG